MLDHIFLHYLATLISPLWRKEAMTRATDLPSALLPFNNGFWAISSSQTEPGHLLKRKHPYGAKEH